MQTNILIDESLFKYFFVNIFPHVIFSILQRLNARTPATDSCVILHKIQTNNTITAPFLYASS